MPLFFCLLFLLSFTTLSSSSPPSPTVFFLLSGKLQADPDPPPLFPSPLAPVRAPLLGHTRQRGGPLWRSGPGIWLVRRNVWSVNEHTHSKNTYLRAHTHTQLHNKLKHTNTLTVEPDRLMRRNDTASLVCHRPPSHPFFPLSSFTLFISGEDGGMDFH